MPDELVVVDLEATCNDDPRLPAAQMECIEIGAVHARFGAGGLEVAGEFSRFVRPQLHPELSRFCQELTGIGQARVDAADPFPEVFAAFRAWVGATGAVAWGSWGAYDRKQLELDCARHGVPCELPPHRNLKREFTERLGLRRSKGMKGALRIAGLELEGQHHRGIDDARNIARLQAWVEARA